MATTKKKIVKKRKKSPLSAGMKRKKTPRKKMSFLSESLNPTKLMNDAKSSVAASLGGLAAGFIESKLPATSGRGTKIAAGLAVGFVMNVFGLNNVGNGFNGGMQALAFKTNPTKPLNEDGEPSFASDDSLSDMPLFLDEDNNPMVLEEDLEDGESYYRYLSEEEIQMLEEDPNSMLNEM